ncbi:Platinum sensitivity protein [Clarireedia jacksonii]
MAQAGGPTHSPPNDKRRVKVYELRDGDWFDRGTGFCKAEFLIDDGATKEGPRVLVESEDKPEELLLDTQIVKGDSFQKQQVWTEALNSMDMALSFQEAEGCTAIWKFVNSVQLALSGVSGPSDDGVSDDVPTEPAMQLPTSLPNPGLGNLHELESQMRGLNTSPAGREALVKLVINEDYIRRLIPLVEVAEDMEDLGSLHRLCTMMKVIILLNDNSIIEHIVEDEVVLGVVGALEYDPDFPSHKANHRHWLGKEGRYKEVVRIDDDQVRKKIHHTYRLQYLKDVVLARILDDPTFSVLNGLIFFNQVEIVQHLQTNAPFLKELFGVFGPQETDQERKKEAVLFIQQCCAIAKNLQQPARQQLYNNFLGHGLLSVINFALRHNDVGVRVGATDVLVSMIDHDPQMIRQTIFRQMNENQTPLTDSLIDLLLVEADLGVKAQIADAIKVLLDSGGHVGPLEALSKANGDFGARVRPQTDPQHELFLNNFYEKSAKKLFKPLVDLKGREDMDFSVHQVSLFIYLIEILCFFIRQHGHRTALKFFRNLIGIQDEYYMRQMIQDRLFEPIIDIVIETMPRDNLLNSACLEFFEFIKNHSIKVLMSHLVENYREKFESITYVETFRAYVQRYDGSHGFTSSETSFLDTEEESPRRPEAGRGGRWSASIKDLDETEEEYFNTSDDEEEKGQTSGPATNGASPSSKPLVDYNSDEENENSEDLLAGIEPERTSRSPSPRSSISKDSSGDDIIMTPTSSTTGPLERLSEKRRREDEEDDEMGKLSQHKRRTSPSSVGSNSVLRRKKGFNNVREGNSGSKNKIAISLSPAIKTGGDSPGGSNAN